jgi:hypothetical protein
LNVSLDDLIDAVYDATNSHNEQLKEEMTKISRQLIDNGKNISELVTMNRNLKRNLEYSNQENKKVQKLNESLIINSVESINNKLDILSDKLHKPYQTNSTDLSSFSSVLLQNTQKLIDSKEESFLIQKNWTQREIDLNNKKLENEVLLILSYTI